MHLSSPFCATEPFSFVISELVLWGDCVTSVFDFDFVVTSSKPVLSVLILNILTSAVNFKDKICHFSVFFLVYVCFGDLLALRLKTIHHYLLYLA